MMWNSNNNYKHNIIQQRGCARVKLDAILIHPQVAICGIIIKENNIIHITINVI